MEGTVCFISLFGHMFSPGKFASKDNSQNVNVVFWFHLYVIDPDRNLWGIFAEKKTNFSFQLIDF